MLQVVFKINSINSKIKIDLKKYVFCYITDVNLKTGQLKAKNCKKKKAKSKKEKNVFRELFAQNYHRNFVKSFIFFSYFCKSKNVYKIYV